MSLEGLVATRFTGKPLRQPKYTMRDVPRTTKDLSHSTLYHITDREHLNDSMAEFVLLCNEVMNRKALKHKSKSSKPLSLEYMADRLDVDDPIFGFMIRTDSMPEDYPVDQRGYFKKGMCQGFITVTTFTNWQKSFRWDSTHDSAFAYDSPELAAKMESGGRVFDQDGSLASQLQNTVRCGDPFNEGVVWPKIAEISLLGALGCGKTLLSLVIERLEAMPANGDHNYDYVVLQATDNSIPFYESMGFKRVGCVNEEILAPDNQHDAKQAKDVIINSEPKSQIVSSPVFTIKTQKNGDTAADFAKKYNVNVWDIIFLNKFMYPELTPRAFLMKGTSLFIPDVSKLDGSANARTQWYLSADNETPREIAKQFNVTCKELLAANRGRIEDLKAHSRLIEGTKLQVSNLDKPVDKFVPYIHWTFPDSKFQDNPDPSYMMARKLNRKTRFQAKVKPVEDSFAIKVQTEYDSSSIPTSIVQAPVPPVAVSKTPNKSKKRKRHPEQPLSPKRPKTAFMMFLHNEKDRLKSKNVKILMPQLTKVVSQHWRVLPTEMKAPLIERNRVLRESYEQHLEIHKIKMKEFSKQYPDWDPKQSEDDVKKKGETKLGYKNLFNKVVKLNKEGQREAGTEFQYYFVLTYIPDLFWCHLAPLRKAGVFGPNRKKVEGRTKWMLVDEGEGKELDITGAVCQVIKARVMKGCADADKEEWDIIDPNAPTINSTHFDICAKQVQKKNQETISTSAESHPSTQSPTFPKSTVEENNLRRISTISASDKSINESEVNAIGTISSDPPCFFSEQISESECSTDAGADTPVGSKEHNKPIAGRTTSLDMLITPIVVEKKSISQSLNNVQTSLTAFFKK